MLKKLKLLYFKYKLNKTAKKLSQEYPTAQMYSGTSCGEFNVHYESGRKLEIKNID